MKSRTDSKQIKIGIVGAGFSGTVLAATLDRFKQASLEIYLCEKTGHFGTGEAYRTRLPFHLLNVKAQDMSAFEDDSSHFVNWLYTNQTALSLDQKIPFEEQFVSRSLYGDYLQALLKRMQQSSPRQTKLQLISAEVVDVVIMEHQAQLIFNDGQKQIVDKVILAIGNNPFPSLPFSLPQTVNYIVNPWDSDLLNNIQQQDPVLIVGTGLTMIDIVLSLHHQQHQGKIYAVSRHGLVPLPHQNINASYSFIPEHLPHLIQALTKFLRMKCKDFFHQNGDWRPVINALRTHIPALWNEINLSDKKRFLRHLLPYWNIHRHRVHHKTADFLHELSMKNQFHLFGGQILGVENGTAKIKLRHSQKITTFAVKCVINCMGPSLMIDHQQPLIHSLIKRGLVSLDALRLGFLTTFDGALIGRSGKKSSIFYALGPPTKGTFWECSAVPEIRKHCLVLANNLLNSEKKVENSY